MIANKYNATSVDHNTGSGAKSQTHPRSEAKSSTREVDAEEISQLARSAATSAPATPAAAARAYKESGDEKKTPKHEPGRRNLARERATPGRIKPGSSRADFGEVRQRASQSEEGSPARYRKARAKATGTRRSLPALHRFQRERENSELCLRAAGRKRKH